MAVCFLACFNRPLRGTQKLALNFREGHEATGNNKQSYEFKIFRLAPERANFCSVKRLRKHAGISLSVMAVSMDLALENIRTVPGIAHARDLFEGTDPGS